MPPEGTTVESQSADTATATSNETPTPVSLTDDTLVTWEGAKEPVKFNTFRGLQSQFTKVSQARAELEKNFKAAQDEVKRLRSSAQRSQTQQQTQQDPLAAIRELPYLKGAEAAEVVGNLIGAMKQRDTVLQFMAQKIAQQEQILGNLNRTHTSQSFDQKINRWLTQLGLDPEFADDAKAYYLAHTGEDLDEVFPDMYKQHVEKRRQIEARIAQKAREDAKRRPFVPGKGGLSTASKELDFAGKSPKEQADLLWDALQAGGE